MKNIVNQSIKKYIKTDILVPFFLIILAIIIALHPAKYSKVSLKGLEVWAKVLIPSLFPFFVLTKMFSSYEIVGDLSMLFKGISTRVYKCPSIVSYVFFMSIITGYPMGSKMIADLYQSGQITKEDATKMTSFCSNSGPMFILGSVAIGMFASAKLGYIVYLSHILGSILNGLMYSGINSSNNKLNYVAPQKVGFSESVMQSVNSILLVGGVITFCFVVIEVITSSMTFAFFVNLLSKTGISKDVLTAMFSGLCEITKGCLMLSQCGLGFNVSALLCTFVISFGGISTFLQSLAFLNGIVKTKTLLLQKFTHAVCSTIVCSVLVMIF